MHLQLTNSCTLIPWSEAHYYLLRELEKLCRSPWTVATEYGPVLRQLREVTADGPQIIVQKEHVELLLELDKLKRDPATSLGELVATLKRLDRWQPPTP